MRTIPNKIRTDEVYVAAFGSFIFISIGTPVKRAAGDSSAAAEERAGQRHTDMNI